MRTSPLLHKLTVLTILILAALCGLLTACKKSEVPLRVRVAGCPLLWDQTSRLVCAVKAPDEDPLTFSIAGPPGATLRFRIGDRVHAETKLPSTGYATVSEPYPKVASRVSIQVASTEGAAEYTLEVLPKMPFPKAYERSDTLACRSPHSARQCLESVHTILTRLDAGPPGFDAAERAFLLGLLGKQLFLAVERETQADEAQALRRLALPVLERAMGEARPTGLLSVEAWALSRMGDTMLGQRGPFDLHLAATTLGDPVHGRALELCPEPSGNIKHTLSQIELDQGNLVEARRLASEAAAITEEFDLVPRFKIATRLQEALAAQSLQQTQEAERLISRVETQLAAGFLVNPCEIARQYNSIAWIRLVARQSGHVRSDPDASFDRAAQFLPKCEELGKVAEDRIRNAKVAAEIRGVLSTNRALYTLLRAEEAVPGSSERVQQLARAEDMSQQARVDQTRSGRLEQMVVQQDLAYLAARIALLRGQTEEALLAFAQLEQLTTRWLSPHYRWASLVGQADAHLLRGDTEEARTRYERVEALLDRMTAELPMTAGHQMFLGQFETGTGRYLKLLLGTPGAEGKILEVIRHARGRALHTYARGPSAGAGPSKTDELLEQYWKLLAERETIQAKLRDAPGDELKQLESQSEQVKRKQEALLEALYTGDPASRAQLALRPPDKSELLIACYPLPAAPGEPPPSWVCAGGTADGTQVIQIAAPRDGALEQAAQAVLTGFSKALGQARHLTIFPYGPLRAVAWASVPWAGGRLGDRLTIRYGVDPPSLGGARPPMESRALLVTNPEQNLPGAQRAGEKLRKALPAFGWQLDARDGAPRRGGHILARLGALLREQKLPPALAKEVVASLPSVDLFAYYGHAQSLGPGGWDSHLRFTEDGSISARDIMSLPAVPRKVLLIGCETALSDREAPADEAGLAQAFVLRGSTEVLATTRKVADSTAEELVDKLVQLGALRLDGPPLAAALHDAITALRAQHPSADLDAFRVYTP